MHKRIRPASLSWFNKPELFIANGDKLILETEPNSTLESVAKDNIKAFGLVTESYANFSFGAYMEYAFRQEDDECGIILKRKDEDWFKFGIRKKAEGLNEIFCKRYTDGKSDSCYREISANISSTFVFMQYESEHVSFFYGSTNELPYRLMRQTYFNDKMDAKAGIYACSPGNSYYDCTFSCLELENK